MRRWVKLQPGGHGPPGSRSPVAPLFGAPGRMVLDLSARGREEQSLMSVPPADHVRWRAVRPVDLATSAAFITKISAAGDKILYSGRISGHEKGCTGSSCFLGSRFTMGSAIAVDAAGNAYLAGNTDTFDLPTTTGALLGLGTGAFVAKVNAAGTALVYLTYLGLAASPLGVDTLAANSVTGIAADAAGNAYLTGSTFDDAFPATKSAYQATRAGGTDAFAAELNPEGSAMVWATYLGGKGDDAANAIAVDASGNVWVSGTTASADFPNRQGWSQDGDFVAEVNATGTALTYSARLPADTAAASVARSEERRVGKECR